MTSWWNTGALEQCLPSLRVQNRQYLLAVSRFTNSTLEEQAKVWWRSSRTMKTVKNVEQGLKETREMGREQAALTACMAEPLGGWGSMSSWDGVCPKLRIWASTAWKRHGQVWGLRGAPYRQKSHNCRLEMSALTSGLFHTVSSTWWGNEAEATAGPRQLAS